jgi:hypothetical protein
VSSGTHGTALLPSRFRPGSLVAELVIVIVGVLLAIAADRWNQGRLDRAAETRYLAALEIDLRQDTTALRLEIERAESRESAARLMLSVVIEGQPIEDPEAFVLGVVGAGIYGEPVQSRETYDDLATTGRLGLIRDPDLRQRLADYYQFVERRAQSYDLQRSRVWGEYLPISVLAVPLDLQEWVYGRNGRRATSVPPPTMREARQVAASLREAPELESALRGVVRSSWSLIDNWTLMRSLAVELIERLENEARDSR